MIAMKLLIIRHGESEADLLNVHEGRADFPLTERGERQVRAMAEYVSARYDLTKIYCSTLKRARRTAELLSETTGAPLTPDDRLREFNNGLLAGLDRQTAREKYPIVPNVPIHDAVYEQESKLGFRFRADYMLSKILSENGGDDTVAVVTHGGMINQLYHAFLRLNVESGLLFPTGDTGIHEWRVSGNDRIVVFANYTAHTEGV